MIPYDVKRRCVDLANNGKRYEDIYREYIEPYGTMSLRSFCRRCAEWKNKVAADGKTLDAANLAFKFSPHSTTVQVNGKGEVIQAWIKQQTENRLEELLEAIKDNTPGYPEIRMKKVAAIKEVVKEKIILFGSNGRA